MVDLCRLGKYCGEISLHMLILLLYSHLHIHRGPLVGTGYWVFIQYHFHLIWHSALHSYESISQIKCLSSQNSTEQINPPDLSLSEDTRDRNVTTAEKKYHFKNAQITAAGEPCYIKRQINLLPSTSQTPKEPETRRNSFLDSKFGELYVPVPVSNTCSGVIWEMSFFLLPFLCLVSDSCWEERIPPHHWRDCM